MFPYRALFTPVAKVDATQACGLFSQLPPLPCCWLCSILAALTSTVDVGLSPSLGVWVVLLTVSVLGHLPLWGTFCISPLRAARSFWLKEHQTGRQSCLRPPLCSISAPQVSTGSPKAIFSQSLLGREGSTDFGSGIFLNWMDGFQSSPSVPFLPPPSASYSSSLCGKGCPPLQLFKGRGPVLHPPPPVVLFILSCFLEP